MKNKAPSRQRKTSSRKKAHKAQRESLCLMCFCGYLFFSFCFLWRETF
jgi:hypothetical protein